jgi:hypothetical protein
VCVCVCVCLLVDRLDGWMDDLIDAEWGYHKKLEVNHILCIPTSSTDPADYSTRNLHRGVVLRDRTKLYLREHEPGWRHRVRRSRTRNIIGSALYMSSDTFPRAIFGICEVARELVGRGVVWGEM